MFDYTVEDLELMRRGVCLLMEEKQEYARALEFSFMKRIKGDKAIEQVILEEISIAKKAYTRCRILNTLIDNDIIQWRKHET